MKGKDHKKKSHKKSHHKKQASMNTLVKAINPNIVQLNKQRKVYSFTRSNAGSASYGALTSANTLAAGQNFLPQPVNTSRTNVGTALIGYLLNDVANASEFSTLFSRYRIKKIDVTFNMYDTLTNSDVQPDMYVFKVSDPGLIQSALNLALVDQVANVTKIQFSAEHRSFTKSFYPYTLNSAGGATATGLSNIEYGRWFDLQRVGTATEPIYYGLGVVVTSFSGSTNGVVAFSMDTVYHIECADVF